MFLTFIWKFAPELIKKGYIYAAMPPLYKINMGQKIIYLKDDAALNEFKTANPNKKYDVSRFKGLGEQDPSELAETVMNKQTRQLKQLTMDSIKEATQTFTDLMGEQVEPRKKFLADNAQYANINI